MKYAGLDKPDDGTVYTPMDRGGLSPSRYLVARTAADPQMLLPAVRQVVRDLDPTLPFSDTATMDEHGGAIARTAALAVDARGRIRDRRAAAVDDRHLRRDGVLRPAAHERHQHPPRARRQSARRASARRRAGHEGRRGGRGRGSRGRVRRDAVDVDGAVRRRRDRRGDVCRRRHVPAGRGAARVRRPGETCHRASAGDGAAE